MMAIREWVPLLGKQMPQVFLGFIKGSGIPYGRLQFYFFPVYFSLLLVNCPPHDTNVALYRELCRISRKEDNVENFLI